MGEPEEDGPREDAAASEGAASPEAKRSNDATMALSESEFLALQVPSGAPPAIPAGKPARAASPVSRNDASMWAGSVLVADEFEPLEVPRKPLGRWLFLALFTLGLAGAALYFLWWQPAQDLAASEPQEVADLSAAAAKAAEAEPAAPQPAAAPAPAIAQPAPAAETAPPPAVEPAAAVEPAKPAAAPPPVKKTSSSKKKKASSSKKKKSSKKKTTSKKKTKKKKSRRGG